MSYEATIRNITGFGETRVLRAT